MDDTPREIITAARFSYEGLTLILFEVPLLYLYSPRLGVNNYKSEQLERMWHTDRYWHCRSLRQRVRAALLFLEQIELDIETDYKNYASKIWIEDTQP